MKLGEAAVAAQPSALNRVSNHKTASAALECDVELMLRVRQGESECFALLLERHRAAVVSYLYRMVQNEAVAEELAQDVFLRVYRSRKTYEPAAKFTTWLFRIATRVALNWIRDEKNEKRREPLDQDSDRTARRFLDARPTVEQRLVSEVKLQEIRDAVDALPVKQRAAVLMHKYQELEYSQIAQALDCSESAVKSLLFRAYETLRARLAHLA
jgi:RNA polymerase sigma-70 factor (ECF subfamily)